MSEASHDVLVSTVVVGYENPEDVERCLISIAAMDSVLLKDLTLVDHSATERCRTVADRFEVHYVPSPNRGFGAGANVGAQLSRGRFLFFLNPDAELRTALTPVVAGMGGRDSRWAGVALLTEAGQPHADAYRMWFFSAQRAVDRLLVALRLRKPPAKRPLQNLCGGAMVVPREVFRQIGGFDEAFFLYGEDADLTLRLAEQSVELVLLADVVVEHRAGSSGRRTPVPIQAHQGFSAIYLVGKHKGHLWAVLALVEMVAVSTAGAVAWAVMHREDRRGGLARMARISGGARALVALRSG